MIISKEMITYLLEHFNTPYCDIDFLNDFSEGGDSDNIVNAAKFYDALNGGEVRQLVTPLLLSDASIWLKMKGTIVKEIYQVFNPLTGQHITCNSVEEAKEAREQVMKDYLESQKGLFSVAQEIETTNGDTLWNPIDLDNM